jgi:hypothetical protein
MCCGKIALLFDHFVRAEQGHRHVRPTAVAVLRLILSSELVAASAFAGCRQLTASPDSQAKAGHEADLPQA